MKLTNFEKDFVQMCADTYIQMCDAWELQSISRAICITLDMMHLGAGCPAALSSEYDPTGGLVHTNYHCAYCSCGHANPDLNVHECVLLAYGDAIRDEIYERSLKRKKGEDKESE